MKSSKRIAFVVDALPSLGGGERVLFSALEAFPHAELFTLVYNKHVFSDTPLANRKIKTSFIDRIPLAHEHHRLFLPLMPHAIEQFDLRNYEIIVSFSYAVAHGIRNFNSARHVSYTYTPMRYAWTDLNINGIHSPKKPLIDLFMKAFRIWDKRAASRVHQFAAISQAVSRRIADAYQRKATVIYPPVEVSRFKPASKREDFYITVTRLVAHKRLDIMIKAFSQLKRSLLIIGDGPELPRLKSMATPNIHFLGHLPDEKVVELLGKAHGFVCATEEDFGIAIVEAQAAGCPVIAYARGGALETVVDGVTGLHVPEQSPECFVETIRQFECMHSNLHTQNLVQNAQRFDKEIFIRKLGEFIKKTESD
jgi:glycosyltransferase involved in cell wall biosynthesis